jgi:topoisomerase-4 subunit A
VVLPAAFPNLLANGSSGIAVGMATNVPPHNIDELIAACLHLIKAPGARDETLLDHVQGPDFPTGGIIVEPRASIKQTYLTGRGSFRLRARWAVEDLGRGQWQVVVTEIPYQVQKGKLIERIAELVNLKKIPLLADVRDESAEDLRIVLEPRSRTVDPQLLMEMLFRASDLETRFAMNMNVLLDGRTPQVCSLKVVLRAFLDHRREVLVRRARFRLERIDARLEVLEGLIVAYLNLDRIIAIIRTEDEPKAVMMAEFRLTDVQAEAILNTRLRSLRRLEEMELRAERDALAAERGELVALLGSEERQWERIAGQLRETRKAFGKGAPGGARRSDFDDAPEVEDVSFEAMVEREPVTVVCSAMGWIRALRGHLAADAELKFKDGDGPRFMLHAETTDRLLLMASNGRMFTMACAGLPGGRGMGEPVRLLVDLPNEVGMLALMVHRPGGRLLVAVGRGRRVRAAGGRGGGADSGGAAGAEPARGPAGAGVPAGGGRPRRGGGREPQDVGVSSGGAAGDGARQGRAAPAVQGRGVVGRDHLRLGGGARVEGSGGADAERDRLGRLDRGAGGRGADGAAGIPQDNRFQG